MIFGAVGAVVVTEALADGDVMLAHVYTRDVSVFVVNLVVSISHLLTKHHTSNQTRNDLCRSQSNCPR